MKSLFLVAILALIPSVSLADHGYRDSEGWARVISVEQDVEYVARYVTQEVCDRGYHRERHYRRDSNGNVVGAIIGGVIGSQIGDGNGQIASTIVGATIGSAIGDRHDRRDRYERHRRGYDHDRYNGGYNCYTVQRKIVEPIYHGWIVKYRFRGQIGYHRTTARPEGRYIRLY